MALTATADKRVVDDSIRALGMRNEYRYRSSFNRPNLHYEVRRKDTKTMDIMEITLREFHLYAVLNDTKNIQPMT